MPKWKLIALDLDGTLLNRNGEVSLLNREWLKRAQSAGLLVTLVTGRHVSKVMPIVQELELASPFITSNGCEIWTSGGQLIQRTCLTAEQADTVHQWAVANELSYRAYRSDGVHDWSSKAGDNRAGGAWLKALLKAGEISLARLQQEADASALFEVIGYSNENGDVTAIDLQPRGVDKSSALRTLCTRLGIEQSQVIAFGDDTNDIAMLRWAGLGIAMENARERVRAAADRLASHHDRDGVAHVLKELL